MVKKSLFIIFFAALVLRLALALVMIICQPEDDNFDEYVDTQGYVLLAQNIMLGNGISGSTSPPFTPDTKRTPGYPLFLSAVYSVFGFDNAPVLIIQALISALTCVIAYLVFRNFLSHTASFIGALLLALDTESILNSNFVVTETLFTLLLTLAVYFLFRNLYKSDKWALPISGVLLGTAVYVRPSGLPLSIILILTLFALDFLQKGDRYKQYLLTLVVFLATLAPWYIRNLTAVDRFEFSSAGESRMYRYTTQAFSAADARRNRITLREQYLKYQRPETRKWMEENPDFVISGDGLPISDMREYEYLKLVKPTTGELIRKNLLQVIIANAASSTTLLFDSILEKWNGYMNLERMDLNSLTLGDLKNILRGRGGEDLKKFFSSGYFLLILGVHFWTFATAMLGIWGLVILSKRKMYFPALVFGLIFFYHIFIGGIDAVPRFRYPAHPFIMGLAAITILYLLKKDFKQVFEN